MEKLKIIITAENRDEPIIIDSVNFFTCPAENDTWDGRGYYDEVPGYTQRVHMTSSASSYYVLRASDGSVEMTILLRDTTDTLLFESFSIDTIKRKAFFLIYIGKEYSEKNSKIGDFITCFEGGVRDTPNHYGFPIKGTPEPNDSLFLIWMEGILKLIY